MPIVHELSVRNQNLLLGGCLLFISTMKRDEEPHNEKYRVEYHINNNSTDVLNMMDGLSMEPEREEESDRFVYINPRSVVITSTWTNLGFYSEGSL